MSVHTLGHSNSQSQHESDVIRSFVDDKVIFQSGVNKHKNQLTLDFMDQIWPFVHTKSGTFPSF